MLINEKDYCNMSVSARFNAIKSTEKLAEDFPQAPNLDNEYLKHDPRQLVSYFRYKMPEFEVAPQICHD